MNKRIVLFMLKIMVIIAPLPSFCGKYNFCKNVKSGIYFIEKAKVKEDLCYGCHSINVPWIEWRRIAKYLKSRKILIYYIGDRRKIQKEFIRYKVKIELGSGYYTIICKEGKTLYFNKGSIDMNELKKFIRIINNYYIK